MKKLLIAFLMILTIAPAMAAGGLLDISGTGKTKEEAQANWKNNVKEFILNKYCGNVNGAEIYCHNVQNFSDAQSVKCGSKKCNLTSHEAIAFCRDAVVTKEQNRTFIAETNSNRLVGYSVNDSGKCTPQPSTETVEDAEKAPPATTESATQGNNPAESETSKQTSAGTKSTEKSTPPAPAAPKPSGSATDAPKPESKVTEAPKETVTTGYKVSGRIIDEKDEAFQSAGITYTSTNNTPQGTLSDENGAFSLTVPSPSTMIAIEALSYQTQTIKASELNNKTIKLEAIAGENNLKETVVAGCATTKERKQQYHAKEFKLVDDVCVPDKCESDRYELIDKGTLNARCIDQVGEYCPPNDDPFATTGKYVWKNNELVCESDGCFDGYDSKNGVCEPTNDDKDRTGENCTKSELKAQDTHATQGTVLIWTVSKVTCQITACDDGWDADLSGSKCIESKCECNKTWNKTLKRCEPITDKDCTKSIVGATSAELDCKDGKSYCRASGCDTANGYELSGNECKCTATGFEVQNGKCTPKKVLSADQYQKEIKDLADNAQKMHEKETSLENRMIGAAGIGGVGAGGTMLGASIYETMADADAEEKMTGYLASFRCDYGNGTQIRGGETNVELPGGNDMIGLYTQYAQLANDLRMRKEQLGLRPGIESEIVIDKSGTGLYDDVGTGITGGTYASIARALQNPDGPDAAKWAAQRETTKNTLIAGAVTAGVGAIGSAAANIAVNHDNKNQVKEILAKYEKMKEPFKKVEREVTEQPRRTCATVYNTNNISGTHPNCTCTNHNSYFNINDGCIPCTGGRTVNAQKDGCECSTGRWNGNNCVKDVPEQCKLSGLVKQNECNCIDNAGSGSDNKCECKSGYVETDGKCNKEEPVTPPPAIDAGRVIASIDLSSDMLFESGKDELTEIAKQTLDDFKTSAQKAISTLRTETDYCLIIVGKTDHQGFKKPDKNLNNNKSLSERRAKAVKDKIQDAFNPKNIITYGIADTDCTPATPRNNPSCRSVNVRMLAGSCDELIQEVRGSPSTLNGLGIVKEITAGNAIIDQMSKAY